MLVPFYPLPLLAQSSSLYHQDLPIRSEPRAVPLARLGDTSWQFRELPPPREIRVRDLVTIRVDHKSQTFAQGDLERRKISSIDAILQDWMKTKSQMEMLEYMVPGNL